MSFNARIDALLTAVADDDADAVERALQIYDVNDIVAVMAKRLLDAEAGGGSLTVLRTGVLNAVDYTETFYVFDGDLPAGTVIVKLWALLSLDFNWTGGSTPKIELAHGAIGDTGGYNDIAVYDLNNGFPNGGDDTNTMSEWMPLNGPTADTELTNISRANVVSADANVSVNFGGGMTLTAGTYEVFALVLAAT